MQSQCNTGDAIMVIATQRKHCNRASLLPRHLNGCYRWLRLLQGIRRLVATKRSSIAMFVNGCYWWHMLLPHYLDWLLQIWHLLPCYWVVATGRFLYCHCHLFLVARDGISIATIIIAIATTKCGCYMNDYCNSILFDFHHILQH
jgi:hypothetical protein